jgi:adenosylcobinamide-phosphate synthase
MWWDVPVDPWLVLAAAVLEAGLGYPQGLHRRLPHPVVWIGGLISFLDRSWNRDEARPAMRRGLGIAALAVIIVVSALAGWLPSLLPAPLDGFVLVAIATLGLAQRSLLDHVRAVATPLSQGDLANARAAVGAIVGRDVAKLDEAGVASAALESLAESFNDGVVAPVFWFLVAGLPGLFVYKAVNTADSLIGHREPRWLAFGWASARVDDLMNLIPARIAGGLVALAGGRGWRTMARDAHKHASPNSGWPEAAMAGALGVRLGGPVAYDGVVTPRPVFGDGPPATCRDLERGLKLYVTACGLLWLALALGGLALGGMAWPR